MNHDEEFDEIPTNGDVYEMACSHLSEIGRTLLDLNPYLLIQVSALVAELEQEIQILKMQDCLIEANDNA